MSDNIALKFSKVNKTNMWIVLHSLRYSIYRCRCVSIFLLNKFPPSSLKSRLAILNAINVFRFSTINIPFRFFKLRQFGEAKFETLFNET
jgi:hypothetical protein